MRRLLRVLIMMKLRSLYSANDRIGVCCACKAFDGRLDCTTPLFAPTQRTIIKKNYFLSFPGPPISTRPDPTQHNTSCKTLVNKCIVRTKYFIGLRFLAFQRYGNAFMHLYSHCYEQTVNVLATTNIKIMHS